MMKFGLVVLLMISLPVWAKVKFCPDILEVQTETGDKLTFCNVRDLMVTWNCHESKGKCSLIEDLDKKKSDIKNPIKMASTRNPGSWICEQWGQTVIMAKMPDGSDVCTCLHKSQDSIICTSLLEVFK